MHRLEDCTYHHIIIIALMFLYNTIILYLLVFGRVGMKYSTIDEWYLTHSYLADSTLR